VFGRELVHVIGVGVDQDGHFCLSQRLNCTILVAEVGQANDNTIKPTAILFQESGIKPAVLARFDGTIAGGVFL
jgi:hypothetical protein